VKTSVVLLRVLDHADLPNSQEALRVRVENAQRVSGELDKTGAHDLTALLQDRLVGIVVNSLDGDHVRVIRRFSSDWIVLAVVFHGEGKRNRTPISCGSRVDVFHGIAISGDAARQFFWSRHAGVFRFGEV
jgi:hypothetical protein